jgi:membrane protease subunit HflC
MKRNPITLLTGAILVVIFGLMLFTFQVRTTEVAIVTFFGKYSRSLTEPGFYWRLPYPINIVRRFDKRVQNFERKFEQTTTRDSINILCTVYAGWNISDPKLYLETQGGDELKAENALESQLRNVKNGVLGKHNFSELVSTNQADLKFDQVEQEMLKDIQPQAQKNGMNVQFIGIKQLGLPETITQAVFERMRRERQILVKQYQTEGDKEAQFIRAKADSDANKVLSEARAREIEITSQAEAKASEYYRVLQQNPDLANFMFQRTALEKSLKDRTTLILDQQTPPFNMLKGVTTFQNATNASK